MLSVVEADDQGDAHKIIRSEEAFMSRRNQAIRILTVLALILCLSCQFNFLLGKEPGTKLSPVMAAIKKAAKSDGELFEVIVQFAHDASGKSDKQDRASDRANIVANGGGIAKNAYQNLPFVAATVDLKGLDFLERHPLVTHISIDAIVEGNLYTSAKAIGADQVWAGAAGNPGFPIYHLTVVESQLPLLIQGSIKTLT